MSLDPGELWTLLDACLLERGQDGGFRVLGSAPDWFSAAGLDVLAGPPSAVAERHPVLDHFLMDAAEHWEAGEEGPLRSDIWIETVSGEELALRASALGDAAHPRLWIERVRDFASRQSVYQAARETLLTHQTLLREIDKKELLLHCIVHDLKGPLSGLIASLSLMKDGLKPERLAELVELGRSQAERQKRMIDSILAAFASEVAELEAFSDDPRSAPDLDACARHVATAFAPAFEAKGVALVLSRGPRPLRVVGHADRLERAISNLVENALRHSSRGCEVRLEVESEEGAARCSVLDRGPGVPEAVRERVFERFTQAAGIKGTVGLGLYFVRSNVERWGGQVGCDERDGGGSSFWLRLPLVCLRSKGPERREQG